MIFEKKISENIFLDHRRITGANYQLIDKFLAAVWMQFRLLGVLSMLSLAACIHLKASPLDTSKNPAALAASYLLSALTGKGTVSTRAARVYGQPDFISNLVNNGGVSSKSLNNAHHIVVDSGGSVYIADYSNNRVLYYPAGSTTAVRVYGQGGSFTANTANNGGISADSLNGPMAMVLDLGGNLYVSDYFNHRVLYYPSGSTTATRVYGQGGSFTTNGANQGGLSANSLLSPAGMVIDSGGNLYIADSNNRRILYYPAGSTTPTRVYGQGGSFTANLTNQGGLSADSLSVVMGLALDSAGNLYAAETFFNNRVLYYPAGSTTATRVYGQGGSFTANTDNNGGVSADSLSRPTRAALDSGGNLYVSDSNNNRVLYYPSGSTTATRVYGQAGGFAANTANNGGVSAESLNKPMGLFFDSGGYLYIADSLNNRVLYYGP